MYPIVLCAMLLLLSIVSSAAVQIPSVSPTSPVQLDIKAFDMELSTESKELGIASQAGDMELSTLQNEENIQSGYFKWKECNRNGNQLLIKSMRMSPDPVLRGHIVTTRLTLVVPQTITSGTYELVIWKKIGPFSWKLFDKKRKLSQKIKLPLATGNDEIVFTNKLPRLAPLGQYTGQLTIIDEHHKRGCINFRFRIA